MMALRGATTVTANEAENLRERTLELWDRIRQVNSFELEDIVSVIFTCTRDIDCDYPGKYVRLERGLTRASLLHFNEMNVVGTLPMCIRIQIQLDLPKDRRTIPVYLHEAASLRPDLTQID